MEVGLPLFALPVTFVTMDGNLEALDPEARLQSLGEVLNVLHRGLRINQHDTLTNGGSLLLKLLPSRSSVTSLDVGKAVALGVAFPVLMGEILTYITKLLQALVVHLGATLDGLNVD